MINSLLSNLLLKSLIST